MSRELDALNASTLKYLREHWWDDPFAKFLVEALKPCPGCRILDVGCGPGTAEWSLVERAPCDVTVVGIDVALDKLRAAAASTHAGRARVDFAAGDASALPFACASFDSTFCVAVLQHVNSISETVHEFARVTRPGGRVLVVEPDNSARYWFSSEESGMQAFETGSRFYNAVALSHGDTTDPAVGPKLPQIFAQHRIQPLSVQMFPVSITRLGNPPWEIWESRLETARVASEQARDESIRRLGIEYRKLLERYAEDAAVAGRELVEIQSTLLFATAGRRMAE
jgi:ubiquinone/menaquinone biosynthesis C-methylase UbiE